jgi:NTP pyrophosphatase (non-canonical NTP hydrolase)
MTRLDTEGFRLEVALWHVRMYPTAKADDVLAKLMEEVGELAGSYQKYKWATKADVADVWEDHERDAIGDIMVCLAGYCLKRNIDLDQVTEAAWERVKARTRDRVLNGKPPS